MVETMTPKQCSSFVRGEEKKRYLVLMLTEPWTKVLILRFPQAGPSHQLINHRPPSKVKSSELGRRPGVSRWWSLQPISPWPLSLLWHCCESESFWCHRFREGGRRRVEIDALAHSVVLQPACFCLFVLEWKKSVRVQYVTKPVCMSLPDPFNKLPISLRKCCPPPKRKHTALDPLRLAKIPALHMGKHTRWCP